MQFYEHEFLTFLETLDLYIGNISSGSINLTLTTPYLGTYIITRTSSPTISFPETFNTRISTSCSYFWASNLVYQLSNKKAKEIIIKK
jgi:hypothetical protein